jgi:hypothetical protein
VLQPLAILGPDRDLALDRLAVQIQRHLLFAALVELDVDGGAVVEVLEHYVDIDGGGEEVGHGGRRSGSGGRARSWMRCNGRRQVGGRWSAAGNSRSRGLGAVLDQARVVGSFPATSSRTAYIIAPPVPGFLCAPAVASFVRASSWARAHHPVQRCRLQAGQAGGGGDGRDTHHAACEQQCKKAPGGELYPTSCSFGALCPITRCSNALTAMTCPHCAGCLDRRRPEETFVARVTPTRHYQTAVPGLLRARIAPQQGLAEPLEAVFEQLHGCPPDEPIKGVLAGTALG